LSAIPRYLREPPRQPDYRASRPHLDFVTNLPLGRDEIQQRLRHLWGADEARSTWPEAEVRRLVMEKYANPQWTRRR
jgi:lipoate-protein ligase A